MELYKPKKNDTRGISAIAVNAKTSDIPVADEMVAFMDAHEKVWADDYEKRAWAIAHGQVTDSEKPLRIFVVHPLLTNEGDKINARFPDRRIFNAEIVYAPLELTRIRPVKKTVMGEDGRRRVQLVDEELKTPNTFEPAEGCMTFPKRTPKLVDRVWCIRVRYFYPTTVLGITRLKKVEEWCEGLKAQIFQHELEHFEGKNIYFTA